MSDIRLNGPGRKVEKRLYCMKDRREKESCCGCGACADACKVNAIHMTLDKEGFYYPQIDKARCVNCGQCAKVCPIGRYEEKEKDNLYLGVQAREKELRYSGSSGGVFPILAQYVLRQKGTVYGAGYDSNMNVRHMEVETLLQLERIKRTKYVQSNMDGIYSDIEKRLAENRWVLFCGTPCQAYALKLFLGKSYAKLIVVDLVCYGVPSPGIWGNYVRYLEQKHGGKMTDFSFRDKRNQDNGHTCSYRIDGEEYVSSLYQNQFCRLYFANWILRPSCHKCKFCTVNRHSDFTIGDFWGIEHIRSDLDDGLGTSVVIAHTEKAKGIWNQIKDDVLWFECTKEDLLQPRLLEPSRAAKGRRLFMGLYKALPFSFVINLMDRRMNLRRRAK